MVIKEDTVLIYLQCLMCIILLDVQVLELGGLTWFITT